MQRRDKVKHDYNNDVFTKEDDVSYYLLGVMVTDGCVYYHQKVKRYYMSFGSTDYEWVDKIAHTLCSNPTISKRKDIDFWEIVNCNHYFINWLLNNDCEPSKSLDLKFPSNIPEKHMVDFIRGVIDGDGSISFKDKIKTARERGSKHIRTYFCSSSISFINGIKQWLDELGFKYTYEIEKAGKISSFSDKSKKPAILKSDNYRVSLYHKEAYKLLKLVYYNFKWKL